MQFEYIIQRGRDQLRMVSLSIVPNRQDTRFTCALLLPRAESTGCERRCRMRLESAPSLRRRDG